MFEFDNAKSASNKDKHGIDFVEAQALWDDEGMVVFYSDDSFGEMRMAAIGRLFERNWTAIFTWRDNAIRLISVRRSRRNEEDFYESKRTGQNI